MNRIRPFVAPNPPFIVSILAIGPPTPMMSGMARPWVTFNTLLDGMKLGQMSLPARVLAALLAVAGAAFAVVATVIDWASGSPSSTGGLIFPFIALYVAIAWYVVAGLDYGVWWIRRRPDRRPSARRTSS
jgi:hypothetical protein